MIGKFKICFNFDYVEEEQLGTDDPVALVGVRYTVDGTNIISSESARDEYATDYLPNLLRKWLYYVRSLRDGEVRTFEFTEYSTTQFRLIPDGNEVEIAVTERHSDEVDARYRVDLIQLGMETVDATDRYCEWLGNHHPELADSESVRELQELAESVTEELQDYR